MKLSFVKFDGELLDRTKTVGGRALTTLARTSLPEVLFIVTFIISHFITNADFSYPYELAMPIALLAILTSIFFYMYRLIFRRVLPAHIAALPVAYYLYHYEDLSKYGHAVFDRILAERLETPFILDVLYVVSAAILFGALAYGIVRLAALRPKWGLDLLAAKVALFIVTFNFVVQAVVIGHYWFEVRHQLAYKYNPPTPTRTVSASVSKPDIYYLLFDRYASAETLKNIYSYDNSNFMNYLTDQGFISRDNAYANYPFTMSSVSSTLAMNYEPELAQFSNDSRQTGFPYRAILNDPTAVNLLKQNGYSYNLLSSWWDFARIGVKADSEPTKSFRLHVLGHDYYQSDFSRDIINRTALWPLVKKGINLGKLHLISYDLDRNPIENFQSQMAALNTIATGNHRQPQFTFAHFLMPHDPYVFNTDGTETTYSHNRDDYGADEYTKYTNQLTYTNTQIKKMVTTIKASDPHAIIVMQADEGPYPKEFRGSLTPRHYYDPKNLPVDHMKQKLGILASYYFPDVDQSIVAANMTSNVNTFRFILSHYMGYNLPLLPDCYFSMGNKFNLFNYTLLNKPLTGTDASAACNQYLK